MSEYVLYGIMKIIIFSLYLIFIFLSIQIWFLWKEIDKDELRIKAFVNESFFKRICIYVFTFSIFFMIHEFIEGINLSNAMIYFEFFEMIGFISIVAFVYEWYDVLNASAHTKSIPQVFIDLDKERK